MRKNKIKFSLLIGFTMMVLSVILSVQTSNSGAKVVSAEQELDGLIEKNKRFKMAIVEKSSVKLLSEKAQSLGLGVPSKIVYVEPESGLANAR